MIRLGIICAISIFLLTACFEQRLAVKLKQSEPVSKVTVARSYQPAPQHKAAQKKAPPKVELKTLKAIGYGVESDYMNYPPPRKRLLAIRAAKVDAYRNLAETLYGTRITGMTTVRDAAIESDRFRAYIDAVVRGAQLLALTPKGEGIYEAELELKTNENLYHCFASLTPDCIGQVNAGQGSEQHANAEEQRRESIEITIETDASNNCNSCTATIPAGGCSNGCSSGTAPEVVYYKN